MAATVCTIGDCTRPSVAAVDLGPHRAPLCATHYARHRRGRPLDPPIQRRGLVPMQVNMPRPLLARLRAQARALGWTLSEYVRQLLEDAS